MASTLPESDLPWSSIAIAEINERGLRFEASFHDLAGKHARETVQNTKWPQIPMVGDYGISKAYHRPRFKRIFLDYSDIPIFQPSQITDLKPNPLLFISDRTQTDIESLKVQLGQILMTCSGTVGICSIVNKSYDGQVFSHDLIRISCNKEVDSGYLYALLSTNTGRTLVTTNNYGAVIQHIEPSHLEDINIPYPEFSIRQRINILIQKHSDCIDKANQLIADAEHLLIEGLKLPGQRTLQEDSLSIDSHSVSSLKLHGRFEASYHHTLTDKILKLLSDGAREVTTLEDRRICAEVILPGRFKRVYVDEGQGVTFFGGKQIFELDPSGKKYLSLTLHEERIRNQLTLKENMVLVTCSGTIGRVRLTPKHWDGWTINQHVIRLVCNSPEMAGYVYIWLQSSYGQALITRQSYGAVVAEVDQHQIGEVAIPLLKDAEMQSKISKMSLEANNLYYEAYMAKQDAINIVNGEVFGLPTLSK